MGTYLIQDSTLAGIADAIRSKTGGADLIPVPDMKALIVGISQGGGATEPYIEETYDSKRNLIDVKLHGYTRIRDHAFYECRLLSSVSLPSETTAIGNYAFYYCQDLALESLPDGLTSIGNNAFRFCTNLALNSIPEGVTTLGLNAFYGCTNLALNSIPEGVTSISANLFNGCTGLTSITFKGTPTAIQPTAFTGCTNLTTINVPWAEGAVANAPWGATNATINYNYTGG